ncbi:MAG: 50S ribosomal protein L6 [Pelagibacterales bacterium]|nr:50S ribosomal protein L6 [Pelagibacterales bacterium]
MSRIGKLPIKIPDNTEVNFNNEEITVKGKFGILSNKIPNELSIEENSNILNINVKASTRNTRALHGLYRTLINNMIIGVSEQFKITLNLKGVGYRAAVQGNLLVLSLGYSHPVNIEIPSEISVEVVQNTVINLKACNKEDLGLFAANIRSWRVPEPYKGKGIMYENEIVQRKAGKSGKK